MLALGGFVSGYVAVVEGFLALLLGLSTTSLTWFVLVLLVLGVLGSFWSNVTLAREQLGRVEERLLADARPAIEEYPTLVPIVRTLAIQADVAEPECYVVERDRPESFTIGGDGTASIVVTTGLVDRLSTLELEAVLAHEIGHVANGDSRLLGAALVPVFVAGQGLEEEDDTFVGAATDAVFQLVTWYSQWGVAVLSRGREWTADVGAAALTGSPAAL